MGFAVFWVTRTHSSVMGENRLMHLVLLIEFAMPSAAVSPQEDDTMIKKNLLVLLSLFLRTLLYCLAVRTLRRGIGDALCRHTRFMLKPDRHLSPTVEDDV